MNYVRTKTIQKQNLCVIYFSVKDFQIPCSCGHWAKIHFNNSNFFLWMDNVQRKLLKHLPIKCLFKNYNDNARGNVEQFSICSSDSIWEDEERRNEYIENKLGANRNMEIFTRFNQDGRTNSTLKSTNNKNVNANISNDITYPNEQCYQVNTRNTSIYDKLVGTNKNVWNINRLLEPNSGLIRR